MRIALYQPDIAQNAGTIMRFAACLGVAVDIIEPCGFPVGDAAFRRAGMDYLEHVTYKRHDDYAAFDMWRRAEGKRLVLLTTKAAMPYTAFEFHQNDVLMAGRESLGVPQNVHEDAECRITIAMHGGLRSINVAMAVAMVSGEALRQLGQHA